MTSPDEWALPKVEARIVEQQLHEILEAYERSIARGDSDLVLDISTIMENEYLTARLSEQWGKLESKDFSEIERILNLQSRMLSGRISVVDYGPGSGEKGAEVCRILSELDFIVEKIHHIDYSQDVLEQARKYCEGQGLKVQTHKAVKFEDMGVLTELWRDRNPKLHLYLGQTIGNSTQVNKVMRNFTANMHKGDLFLVEWFANEPENYAGLEQFYRDYMHNVIHIPSEAIGEYAPQKSDDGRWNLMPFTVRDVPLEQRLISVGGRQYELKPGTKVVVSRSRRFAGKEVLDICKKVGLDAMKLGESQAVGVLDGVPVTSYKQLYYATNGNKHYALFKKKWWNKTKKYFTAATGTILAVSLVASYVAYHYGTIVKDSSNVCSEVKEDMGWPKGKGIAKRLDFDGDGRSDLVQWNDKGEWKLDVSTISENYSSEMINHNGILRSSGISYRTREKNEEVFGSWDVILRSPFLSGKWVWPYAEDIDADGREDFMLYEKDTGNWYIKFTRWSVLNAGIWKDWDWVIKTGVGKACKDTLSVDYRKSVYGRPLPGDYNGDGWADLAVVCSDGFWRIDYGGPNCGDYGQVDEEIRFLDEKRLSMAPGWAYLPVFDEVPCGRRLMAYKLPDWPPKAIREGNTITYDYEKNDKELGTGKLVTVKVSGGTGTDLWPQIFGGNEVVIVPGRHASASSNYIHLKETKGNWKLFTGNNELISPEPQGVYGGVACRPVLGDFDGDGIDDRAVSCPDEWRIVYSGSDAPRDADGVKRIPLGDNMQQFTLPGVSYFGGISYRYAIQLIEFARDIQPSKPVGIPIDMVMVTSSSPRKFGNPNRTSN